MDRDNFYNFASLRDSNTLHPGSYDLSRSNSAEPIVSSGTEFVGDEASPIVPNDEDIVQRDTKKYRRNSRIFLAISVVSAVLILVFEVYMYAVINLHKSKISSKPRYAEISIYLALFIFSGVYSIVLTIIGLRTKNMLLLAMLGLFYVAMSVYTGIQYEEVGQIFVKDVDHRWAVATKATNIATIVVLVLTFVVQTALLVFVLRDNVKWFRFKKIGADMRIRRMYRMFQIHRSLLIFDFFFFVGFTVQFIVIMIKDKSSTEFILTVIVLPITLLVLLLSDIATTREIYLLTIFTLLVFCCGCAYVLFKIIRLYTRYTSAFDVAIRPGAYFPGRKSLVAFGIITLIFLLATIIMEVLAMVNYSKGLYPFVSTYYKWLPSKKVSSSIQMQQLEEKDDDSDLID